MRIIAGKFRGRRLKAPAGSATRPTTDRVREALFSILGDLGGQNVVDCFAGTGALGLEALSRGASRVVLLEAAEPACRVIRANVEALAATGQATLLRTSVERAARRLHEHAPFDLVLSDPPWPIADRAARDVARLFEPLVTPECVVVLGHPARNPVELPESSSFERFDRRSWGDSAMSFYRTSNKSRPGITPESSGPWAGPSRETPAASGRPDPRRASPSGPRVAR